MAKLFLESGFQQKENKRKNANFQQNLAIFSAATDSEKYHSNTTKKRTKEKLDRIVIFLDRNPPLKEDDMDDIIVDTVNDLVSSVYSIHMKLQTI